MESLSPLNPERTSTGSLVNPYQTSVLGHRTSTQEVISRNSYGVLNSDVEEGDDEHHHHIRGHGSTVSFHDINYSVTLKDRSKCCRSGLEKSILLNISGLFRQGMNAILGPTGSGKSTLLDVLAGRRDPQGLTGIVLVEGHKQPDNFKCMAGYVVQENILMGTLTVRENLRFSASLRCGKMTDVQREERVQDLIEELGLQSCADNKVGTEFIRGISGGEMKRCSIGIELITSPGVLFLDEPTTGLDASTASSVMQLLHSLSRHGRTIIFSIHQPRFSIFKKFDTVLLLSGGEMVYSGSAEYSLEYFKEIGYEIEEHNNPPDFFLDVINGLYDAVPSKAMQEPVDDRDPEIRIISSNGGAIQNAASTENKLAVAYRRSNQSKRIMAETNPIKVDFDKRVADGTEQPIPGLNYARSWPWQWSMVSRRAVINLLRNPHTSVYQMVVNIIFALVVGAIYWQIDTSLQSGVQNRVGIFFFIIMNMVFANMSATELFIRERGIFIHENVSGFYSVSAYFLAKVFCDILPTRCLPTLVFTAIVYFMSGLTITVVKFCIFLLTLILTTLASCGIAFALSSSFDIVGIANLFISLIYVFMMVFSGLLVNLSTIAVWLRWLRYISLFRYGLAALAINEMKDLEFCGPKGNGTVCFKAGNEYMKDQGIEFDSLWDLWQNELALGCIAVISLFLSYVQLRRLKKLK